MLIHRVKSIKGDPSKLFTPRVKFGRGESARYRSLTYGDVQTAYRSIIKDKDLCQKLDLYFIEIIRGEIDGAFMGPGPFTGLGQVAEHFSENVRHNARNLTIHYFPHLLAAVAIKQPNTMKIMVREDIGVKFEP